MTARTARISRRYTPYALALCGLLIAPPAPVVAQDLESDEPYGYTATAEFGEAGQATPSARTADSATSTRRTTTITRTLPAPAPSNAVEPEALTEPTAQGTRIPDDEYDPEATVTATKGEQELTAPRFVEPGEKIVITGTGWAPDTQLAVKLRHQGDSDRWTQTFARSSGILKHPKSGEKDPTLWALLTSDSAGVFEATIELPDNLTPGEKFYINVASGLLDGDAQATVNTPQLIVGRIPYAGVDENVKCTTDQPFPTYEVARTPVDGKLNIKGWGWCNPTSGASLVAVKIDEARISRLESNKVDANLTIWDFIVPDPATGNFDYDMPLPDGTTSGPLGSSPAFGDGAHTLRFLTGSIKEDDPVRSLPFSGKRDTVFVQGEYKPNGTPETVLADTAITPATRGGVTAEDKGEGIVMTIPNAEAGSFMFVSAFIEDGSRRLFWDDWFVVDDHHRITLPVSSVPSRYTKANLLVQDGSLDHFGDVVGWAPWTRTTPAAPTATPGAKKPSTTSGDSSTYRKNLEAIKKETTRFAKEIDKASKGLLDLVGKNPSRTTTAGGTAEDTEVVEVVEYAPAPATQPARSAHRAVAAPKPASAARTASAATLPTTSGSTNAAAKAAPQPAHTPDRPVKHKGKLTPRNNGHFQASVRDGDFVITTNSEPGDWVYAYLYSNDEVTPLGWTMVGDDKKIHVGVEGLGPGEWAVTAQNPAGEILGWAGLTIPDEDEVVAPADAGYADGPVLVSDDSLMTGTDWALIIGSIALVELVLIGVFMTARGRKRA
ncbi:hypothetical protein [Corynebacterium aquilae]|uniref:Uncharacterized protein n=1 Tax=Corynebacterium aquilae DSM 44791 TaxID=1431546 RepID=A0A1L7CHH8_9CORY|nr:hypothetical protein [Corynebacterium aquilae]APT85302.1 hypothetical protein CAQU_09730 [Corynebacterium aquilae DSM 44791]